MQVLAIKWLPGKPQTVETLANALWLERTHWENMSKAVEAGINRAFNG